MTYPYRYLQFYKLCCHSLMSKYEDILYHTIEALEHETCGFSIFFVAWATNVDIDIVQNDGVSSQSATSVRISIDTLLLII